MIQPVKEKIILGIDPGTTIMGYGVLRVAGVKPEMIAMGIIDLRKFGDHYLKLRHIHERVLSIIESYLPDELAIEAPFFGKNVQSMLKLGNYYIDRTFRSFRMADNGNKKTLSPLQIRQKASHQPQQRHKGTYIINSLYTIFISHASQYSRSNTGNSKSETKEQPGNQPQLIG